ncbi:MAG TPA: hypothetical protein VFM73_00445 [Xanthomonadaceae bacterium]|nr:hypothetical protein [Xanthomonadaceae bacterium]
MPRNACCTVATAILAACLLAACDNASAPPDDAEPAPVAATTEALRLPPDPGARAKAAVEAAMAAREIREIPAYEQAVVDLDGDGTDDLLAWLDDPNWCTPAGCTLLLFHREGGKDVLLAEVAPVRAPIAVAEQTHGGWRDILVTVGGMDGVPAGTVALQHDGIGYPEDPTLMAALASDVAPRAVAVID